MSIVRDGRNEGKSSIIAYIDGKKSIHVLKKTHFQKNDPKNHVVGANYQDKSNFRAISCVQRIDKLARLDPTTVQSPHVKSIKEQM